MCRLPLLLLLAFLSVFPVRADEEQLLFNGKDLHGWVIDGPREFKDGQATKPCWEVRDGKIVCNGHGFGFLRFDQEFADFRLHVEYKLEPPDPKTKKGRGNSGIGIRTGVFDPKRSHDSRPSIFAYEIQVYDDPVDKKPDKHSNMSLYRYVAPKTQATKPAPQWNVVDIECVGPQIKIVLNGVCVMEVDQSTIPEISRKPLKGYVCLQNHGSNVEFRNVRLQQLSGRK